MYNKKQKTNKLLLLKTAQYLPQVSKSVEIYLYLSLSLVAKNEILPSYS